MSTVPSEWGFNFVYSGRRSGTYGNRKDGRLMARTHVVIADEVVDAMDRLVGARGRSRFLEEAAREKLARLELETALEETANTVSSARHPEWRSRRSTAAWVRTTRRTEAS